MKKNIFKRIARRIIYGKKSDSENFIKYLKKKIKIGDGCCFFDPPSCFIDTTRPCLLEIGDDVQVTRGVTILTHRI